jgi:hypothetical protein
MAAIAGSEILQRDSSSAPFAFAQGRQNDTLD